MRSFALSYAAVALMAPGTSGFQGGLHSLRAPNQLGNLAVSMACERQVGSVNLDGKVSEAGLHEGLLGRRDMLVRVALTPAILGASFPQPSYADMTLNSFKRAYFRYAPRIEEGRDFYVLEVRQMIEKGEWDKVASLFELTSVAQEGSSKKSIGLDIKQSALERTLFVPMQVFITAFEEKGTGPKQRKMNAQVDELIAACEKIREAAQNKDKQAALAAWDDGREHFNKYFRIANKGMTMQVRQFDLIPEDSSKYVRSPARPLNTYAQVGKATQQFQFCDENGCVK